MADRAEQLRDLVRLTDATLRAEQVKMAQCNDEISALRKQIAALAPARASGPSAVGAPDPAQRAGADIRWNLWAEDRRKALNKDLARLFVMQDGLRSQLALAFGKHQATVALSDQEIAARRLNAARRN